MLTGLRLRENAAGGAQYFTPYFRSLLADGYTRAGRPAEALGSLENALAEAESTGEAWYQAELHRHIGETHFNRGDRDAARRSFDRALGVARVQRAKLWELQAATSYARLLRDKGNSAQARELLGPVYAWFTEGFDTVPLRQAKALLDALPGP
jgi:predicted ATPase